MIFQTVGARQEGFERLVRMLDELVGEGAVTEPVLMQIGHTRYEPKHAPYVRFLTVPEYRAAIRDCDRLVCRGGAGTIMTALSFGKVPIVVPPRRVLGESGYDDGEVLELSGFLARDGRVIIVENKEELRRALSGPPPRHAPRGPSEALQPHVRILLEQYLGSPVQKPG